MTTAPLLQTALALHDAGCCVVPARTDGTKAPAAFWKQYQKHQPGPAQIQAWFANGTFDGFGIICGTISGGLEMLEFEGRAVTARLHVTYAGLLKDHGLGELWQHVISGYTEVTPGGGIHVLYRVTGIARGNTKLARNEAGDVLIETRGEGGFTITAPSGGRTHPSGRAWQIAAGGPATIVTISEEERDTLHAIANLLDQQPSPPPPRPATGSTPGQDRPGDDYNTRVTWDEILIPNGWTCVRTFGPDARGWRRPGKDGPGISATTREQGGLYVFSTSTPFDIETPYSKFGAYAVLNHGGDYSAAAAQLARDGYGTPREHPDQDIGNLIAESTGDPPIPPEAGDDLDALAAIAGQYTSVDWEKAWDDQPDDIDWLIPDFIERGTVNALFAKPGTGKSLIALELAVTIVREGSSVVYIDDENRVSDLVERLQAFGCEPGELGQLHTYSFAGLPPLDTAAGGVHLLALAVTQTADLVILDTTTRMVQGKENDSDTFLQLYRCSLVPLKARGMTVLRLDHPGKDADRGQRGSSAKDGDVDTIWKLETVLEDAEYHLERTKSRSGHGAPAFTLTRSFEPLTHDWVPGLSVRIPLEIQEWVNILDVLNVPLGTSRDDTARILRENGHEIRNEVLGRVRQARKQIAGDGGGRRDGGDSRRPSPVPTYKGDGGTDERHQTSPEDHEACEFGSGLYCVRPDCANPNHRAAP